VRRRTIALALLLAPILSCPWSLCVEHPHVVPSSNVIDVRMHAMKPEDFAGPPESANFGAFQKTYRTNERDPEELLSKTVAQMDMNHISKAVISGDDDVVAKWVQQYPDRFSTVLQPLVRRQT
jgi:hypothetical protein